MTIPRGVLAKYIIPGCTFVETGSRWADSCIRAIELGAAAAWTCEADELFATLARMHLKDVIRNEERFTVSHYHSILWLTNLRPTMETVVFLDAHTDRGSPVLGELAAISNWPNKPSVILIDDMRCMSGWQIDPDVIKSQLEEMGYQLSFEDGVVPGDILVGTR